MAFQVMAWLLPPLSTLLAITFRCKILSCRKPPKPMQASFLPEYKLCFSFNTRRCGSFSGAGKGSSLSSVFFKLSCVRLGGNLYLDKTVCESSTSCYHSPASSILVSVAHVSFWTTKIENNSNLNIL